MADREEEVALQSSEEKGSGQDMGVPNQVSAIRCIRRYRMQMGLQI